MSETITREIVRVVRQIEVKSIVQSGTIITKRIVARGVPGRQGEQGIKGDKGDSGDVGGTLPWTQITGKPTAFSDFFECTVAGAQTIPLTHAPLTSKYTVYINGVRQAPKSKNLISLVGQSVVIPVGHALQPEDELEIAYEY